MEMIDVKDVTEELDAEQLALIAEASAKAIEVLTPANTPFVMVSVQGDGVALTASCSRDDMVNAALAMMGCIGSDLMGALGKLPMDNERRQTLAMMAGLSAVNRFMQDMMEAKSKSADAALDEAEAAVATPIVH